MKEQHTRTVIKSISYRVVGTLVTAGTVYVFTGALLLSLGVGFMEIISKTAIYYLHERLWEKIPWGKVKHPLSEIPVKRDLAPEDMADIKKRLTDLGYL